MRFGVTKFSRPLKDRFGVETSRSGARAGVTGIGAKPSADPRQHKFSSPPSEPFGSRTEEDSFGSGAVNFEVSIYRPVALR
jgi:hypothetical protein